jgi:hypothetical protein
METADNIVWSIYSDTSSKDIDEWVEENGIGFGDNEKIENIPPGIYEVSQRNWNSNRRITLKTKVLVWDGKIDIQSSKEAVAEFLNKTGDGHYFIEGVMFGKGVTKVYDKSGNLLETKRTIEFRLGS